MNFFKKKNIYNAYYTINIMTDKEKESEDKIKKSYDFFFEKYKNNESFTKDELFELTDWIKQTFKTYFTKIFRHFLKEIDNKFIITEAFRRYSNYKNYRKYFSQSRKIRQEYITESYNNVIIYEFFLPLTNESALKSALDSLFYKDTLIRRLKTVAIKEIEIKFSRKEDENDHNYYDRICNWISKKFFGYSIGHFQGRFRIEDIDTFKNVAIIQEQGKRYLEDETTAIIKFIFPCNKTEKNQRSINSFSNKTKEEDLIRYFFKILFINVILEVVNAEEEIWMLESGIRTKLYIWKVDD